MKKKIYLSAPALVCCAGQNKDELYESCLSGNQDGIVMQELSGARGLNSGGKYPLGLITKEMPEVNLPEPSCQKETAHQSDRFTYTENTKIIRIINAVMEQLRPAVDKAISKYGHHKIGVCLGSCDNGSEAILAQNVLLSKNKLPEEYKLNFQSASFCAEFITRKFGISGPAFTVATACASGASAIVRGAELIRAGHCSAVIAGGADIVTETVFAGFLALEAVSDSLTNPFSKNRKGLNLGEGAAFFLLESDKNSNIELLGSGESADAHHMTAPGIDGAGPAKAMKAALHDAGISSGQIGYVNLHGTGTYLNDKAEILAMKTVFGPAFPPFPPASSTKPITGHTLGAAGALEAAICWMVLNKQMGLPVHCWDGARDEELLFYPFDDSPFETPSICEPAPRRFASSDRRSAVPLCMSNSFGFGGCNVSLILGSCDHKV